MKRVLTFIVAIFLLSGCASDTSQNQNEFSSQDAMFAEMMIPHHKQAIEMSDLALAKSKSDEILSLAKQIKEAQQPEIELMRTFTGENAGMHAGHTMMGMLDESEMAELSAATGEAFDQLFLKGMIEHHKGAIQMAEMVVGSANSTVSDLAKSIISSQTAEIDFMETLLKN